MRLNTVLLAIANTLLPFAILIFATGFFLYKPSLPGFAEYDAIENSIPPKAPFDKIVLLVVDALRSDFVFSANSGFKFTQQLISSGAALPFTAHATSPTVTQPRVKAITTGSIPSYRDVIFNFIESDKTSSLAFQDTWLAQLRKKEGGKLVMYGDDTWLKLFPDFFERSDGTTSFFVSDFTEVDNNVTRHVPRELENSDWNGMVMHYLGLDHIGHKTGPYSPYMIPKQVEMDGIVKQIYSAIESKPHLESTLLVLLGDHGMNEGGNHGGSAPGETSTALVFISPKMRTVASGIECPTTPHQDYDYYQKVEQSDIAPTLAGLLGFPIPKNNLGVFISAFLPFWSNPRDRVQLVYRNALQILTLVQKAFPSIDFNSAPKCQSPSGPEEKLACQWNAVKDILNQSDSAITESEGVIHDLTKFCADSQDILISAASNYNLFRLFVGIGIATVSVSLVFPSFNHQNLYPTATILIFTLILGLYGIMMFASSYVEEEQNFWYWVTSAWFIYIYISARSPLGNKVQSSSSSIKYKDVLILILLATLRITRRWNQTGQKFAGAPDIAHSSSLSSPEILLPLVALTYFIYAFKLRASVAGDMRKRLSQTDRLAAFLVGMLVALAFFIKLHLASQVAPELIPESLLTISQMSAAGNLVNRTRALFIGLATVSVIVVFRRSEFAKLSSQSANVILFDLLNIFLLTQTGLQNIPVFLLFTIQTACLSRLNLTPTQISVTVLMLVHVSFYALGNSNQTSSIDLSNAYNGVAEYNAFAVAFLVFVSNWAGPIYWASAGANMLIERQRELQKSFSGSLVANSFFSNNVALFTLFSCQSLLSVMAACVILREHLFIWTVFSPKYLYAGGWVIPFHLGITIGWCGFLWWVSGVNRK